MILVVHLLKVKWEANMFDSHNNIENWGLMPFIKMGHIHINTYSVFMFLGLLTGYLLIRYFIKRQGKSDPRGTIPILVSALVFGTLGAKIPIWIAHYPEIFNDSFTFARLLSGRTIVGGFIGGFLGVQLVKKVLGVKIRKGNQIAPGIALGMMFGRTGCLLKGCCFGIVSNVPWAMDFGDHILRHPTQMYEIIFHFLALTFLLYVKSYDHEGGKYLSIYLITYMGYRFLSEFVRIHDSIFLGLTSYQLFAVIGILLILVKEYVFMQKKEWSY